MLAIAMSRLTNKVVLYVRIPSRVKRRLTRKAKAEDLPVSKIVTRLLDKAMDGEDEKQACEWH